jgi:DNA-binding NarL/FixJ family response regulator
MAHARVVIADDHSDVLARVAETLKRDYEIVAAVRDGMAAVAAVNALHPDLIVLDVSMPGLNGFEVAARLRSVPSPPRIVFLTMHEDRDFIDAARNVGARGFVIKRAMSTELLPAITRVAHGETAFPVENGLSAYSSVGGLRPR